MDRDCSFNKNVTVMHALWRFHVKSCSQYHNDSESDLPALWKVFNCNCIHVECMTAAAALLETVLMMTMDFIFQLLIYHDIPYRM